MTRQLRVRITDQQRQFLEQLGTVRSRGENLSDIVRFLISEAESSSSLRATQMTSLSPEVEEIVECFAEELGRKPQGVLEDCVRGIQDIVEGDERPPLIAEEIRLRRRYRNTASKADVAMPASHPKR